MPTSTDHPATEPSDRKIAVVRDLDNDPETFERRALQAVASIGGEDARIDRRFDLDGAPRLAVVFRRSDGEATTDIAERVAQFGVAFDADKDATSQ